MKTKTKTTTKIITIILCIISVLSIFSIIYDIEKCTIYDVSYNDICTTVTVEHNGNLYSVNYGLNMLYHFIKKADKNATVVFYNDEIVAII